MANMKSENHTPNFDDKKRKIERNKTQTISGGKVMSKLLQVQSQLRAPKLQNNSFGGYKYRSCEDILEAVKPLLAEVGATVTITDDIIPVANRVYVMAKAEFIAGDERHTVTAYAREPESKKGMDESQITGAASSYARKYALNGLFLIDDTKDADATNDHGQAPKQEKQPEPAEKKEALPMITPEQMAEIKTLIVAKKLNAEQVKAMAKGKGAAQLTEMEAARLTLTLKSYKPKEDVK